MAVQYRLVTSFTLSPMFCLYKQEGQEIIQAVTEFGHRPEENTNLVVSLEISLDENISILYLHVFLSMSHSSYP